MEVENPFPRRRCPRTASISLFQVVEVIVNHMTEIGFVPLCCATFTKLFHFRVFLAVEVALTSKIQYLEQKMMDLEPRDAKHKKVEHVMIISGDELYQMNYMDFVQKHIDTKADTTVACAPMNDR